MGLVEVQRLHLVASVAVAAALSCFSARVAGGVVLGSVLMALNVEVMELAYARLRSGWSTFWVALGVLRFGAFLGAAWIVLEWTGADALGLAAGVALLPGAAVLAALRGRRPAAVARG